MDYPARKQTRLESFDYSENGAYFVTICTENRRKILSNINVGANCVRPTVCTLSPIGEIIEEEIQKFTSVYPSVFVDKYVIMPNHIHMILLIDRVRGRTQFAPTLSRVIKQFKGAVTKQVGKSIWQRSYYDHIIRGKKDYDEIWTYIDNNPKRWELDEFYI